MPTTARISEVHEFAAGNASADIDTALSSDWVLATNARRILGLCQTAEASDEDEVEIKLEAASSEAGAGAEDVAEATFVADGAEKIAAFVEVQAAELPEGKPYVRVTAEADTELAGAVTLIFGQLRHTL